MEYEYKAAILRTDGKTTEEQLNEWVTKHVKDGWEPMGNLSCKGTHHAKVVQTECWSMMLKKPKL
ncbi:hypothetical protein A2V71_02080 [Candidatus Berkelbacteria bacterium RBG_13_40_8]|uniref:DUF1737 domain-containing protein n=1 Tax=Candidatus Berkelbacteria bacterium RBG_13_40_8 TaxID=1797467 RepID=A0A1F5DPT9_9BACT|nr:MAG: hypothetical protein A2V71_02080 [Candidatus Berkelbacteria bacterium RBG_13_40_8]